MVPFWQRRLLLVTLPATLFTAGLLLAGIGFLLDSMRLYLVTPEDAIFGSQMGSLLAAWLGNGTMVAISALAIARPRPHQVRGAGLWLARTVSWIRMFYVAALATATVSVLTSGLFAGLSGLVGTGAFAFALVAALSAGTGGLRPRELILARNEIRFCAACSFGLAAAVPFAAVAYRLRSRSLAGPGIESLAMLIQTLLATLLLGLLSSAILAWIARAMAARNASYHARHCKRCGYDLLGTERHTCPECNHHIDTTQAGHLAQLNSMGSHSTRSSPTAST